MLGVIKIAREEYILRCDESYKNLELLEHTNPTIKDMYMLLSIIMFTVNTEQSLLYTTSGKDNGSFMYITESLHKTRKLSYSICTALVTLRNRFAHNDFDSIDELYYEAVTYIEDIRLILATFSKSLDLRYKEITVRFDYK